MELGNWLAEAIISENNIKNVIVIYPGRFQPMGRHHAAVYKKLASKFGKSNTYIATSDKVKLPKSPLNFKEKFQVMKQHGITNVVQVKNPYQSIEITSKYDPDTTAVLFAVGKKDMTEDPRFKVGTKKNGDPSYFQYYDKNQGNLQSYTKHGYLVVAPHVDIQIPGFGEMSGTTLRQVLATAEPKVFKDVMGFFDPRIHAMLKSKFAEALGEQINEFVCKVNMSSLIKEISIANGTKKDVDDGPRYFYGSQRAYESDSKTMAEALGYSVLNYIMDGGMTNFGKTSFPDGPPMGVSYFPVGDAGAKMAGTDYTGNIKGKPAYKKWQGYIKNVATQVGYKFLNFLGAEDSIMSSKAEPSKPQPLVQEQIQDKEWWSNLIEASVMSTDLQTKKITINFEIDDKKISETITLAMSPDSRGLFEVGENVGKYNGLSAEEATSYNETPDDAYAYGMVNTMNDGKDIYFWTNGNRLAGAAKNVGAMPAILEQLSHEGLHLGRSLIAKHVNGNGYPMEEWPSIGEQDNDKIDEETLATVVGVAVEQITKPFLEMASQYIPMLNDINLNEDITVPINIGDTVLGGRFKNKKIVVKSIGKNEKGDITINGRPLLKYRIPEREPLEEDVSKYVKKLSEKFKTFLQKMKQEGQETKQAFQLMLRSMQGETLTKNEKIEIGEQMKDVLKLAGFTAASILPGGFIYLLLTKVTALKKHLVPSSFQEGVLNEAKANTHLTHLEELILTQGEAGYKQAREVLIELIKNLKGNSNAKVNTTVKWDGAPAMFVGINPDNGRFFVGTKSVFNKDPKINYTDEDIERNHGHAPGLADKLSRALKVLPILGIKGILQGDFMFDDSTLKTQDIDGVKHYTFRPNTITYAVEADSALGKQLEAAEFGIVFHTAYKSLDSGAEFGANVSGLRRTPAVWFDDAFFKDTTGTVLLTNDEAKKVASLIKSADAINVDYDKLPSVLLNTYINSEIRTNQFLDNPKKSFETFKAWVQSKIDKKIDKLKSERGKQKAITTGEAQMASIEDASQDIINVFNLSKLLAEAKLVFVRKYNDAVYNTKHFKDDGKGGLAVTAPEGYVAIDRFGNGVKLVDRLEFSRANFAMDKGFAK